MYRFYCNFFQKTFQLQYLKFRGNFHRCQRVFFRRHFFPPQKTLRYWMYVFFRNVYLEKVKRLEGVYLRKEILKDLVVLCHQGFFSHSLSSGRLSHRASGRGRPRHSSGRRRPPLTNSTDVNTWSYVSRGPSTCDPWPTSSLPPVLPPPTRSPCSGPRGCGDLWRRSMCGNPATSTLTRGPRRGAKSTRRTRT